MSAHEWLTTAVALASANVETDQLPFGAVVVRDGQVIGIGANTTRSSGDPTDHAEVRAIRDACRQLGRQDLTGAVVYTSCEPCVMCQATAVTTGIVQLVYACSSADAAALGFPASALQTRLQLVWREAEPQLSVAADAPSGHEPFLLWNSTHGSTP